MSGRGIAVSAKCYPDQLVGLMMVGERGDGKLGYQRK